MIRAQQHEANAKRQQDFIEKQNRARAQVEEKLQREAQEQMMYEREVARMEQEELMLINRLKNTKMMEEQAHQQLESAIKDPLEQTSRSAVSQQQQQRKSASGVKRPGQTNSRK